jgi:hypothetical protein
LPPQTWFTQWTPGLHPLSSVQATVQSFVPVSHRPGAQEVAAAGRQVPAPSQVRLASALAPEHDGAAHSAPSGCLVHCPEPLQTPVVPQVEAACTGQRGSALLAVMGLHSPLAAEVSAGLHDRQAESQRSLQHTPWAEQTRPEAHSASPPQAAPLALATLHVRPSPV